ncbi:DUF6415 family natural product biosynthesis protein [Streptomyces sp. NPDC048644]|uniref:DUF6415 family natural product biosynthesis protein n=1 Tax=Streptomyces sp. NPDC048644 TaxID=3365582 RepID=UPI0037227980
MIDNRAKQPPCFQRSGSPREAAMLNAGARDAAAFDCDRALAPHQQMPPPDEIADLTARLTAHCTALADALNSQDPASLTPRTSIALRDWAALREGPGAGAFGTWLHLRAVARTCRVLLDHGRTNALSADLPDWGL